jgi:hypothetical protein
VAAIHAGITASFPQLFKPVLSRYKLALIFAFSAGFERDITSVTMAAHRFSMLGFSTKLPVSDEEHRWVDDGFRRLEKLLGRRRMLEARVVLPTAEDFPDPYDRTPASAEMLFCRVCTYMQVDRSSIELEVFADETELLRESLPHWRGDGATRAAGMYVHNTKDDGGDKKRCGQQFMVVAIRSTQLKDPMSLVATVAHELGHVILLGGGLLNRDTADHEPMTDLLTVFLGLVLLCYKLDTFG